MVMSGRYWLNSYKGLSIPFTVTRTGFQLRHFSKLAKYFFLVSPTCGMSILVQNNKLNLVSCAAGDESSIGRQNQKVYSSFSFATKNIDKQRDEEI